MKNLIILISLLSCQFLYAQQDTTYKALLENINEVSITDSLLLKAVEMQTEPLDTFSIKRWFTQALDVANNNRLKNRDYYLTGKITSNTNFDLLVVVEQKKKADVTGTQVVYLVSIKKDGGYISSLEVAVAGIKNKSTYNTSSLLYKDNKIRLDTKFNLNDTLYADVNVYKINTNGRFLLAPKY
jgi:hypothetical protein